MPGFADLATAQAWVFDLQKYGIKFGLSSTLDLLARLAVPYEQGRYLHIAGTNGKGSVAAMLSAILTRAGYPVGLFTSPTWCVSRSASAWGTGTSRPRRCCT